MVKWWFLISVSLEVLLPQQVALLGTVSTSCKSNAPVCRWCLDPTAHKDPNISEVLSGYSFWALHAIFCGCCSKVLCSCHAQQLLLLCN